MNENPVLSLRHVTSGYHSGGLFRRGGEMVIPISRILRFGEDVILVELPGPGAPAAEETAPL